MRFVFNRHINQYINEIRKLADFRWDSFSYRHCLNKQEAV